MSSDDPRTGPLSAIEVRRPVTLCRRGEPAFWAGMVSREVDFAPGSRIVVTVEHGSWHQEYPLWVDHVWRGPKGSLRIEVRDV